MRRLVGFAPLILAAACARQGRPQMPPVVDLSGLFENRRSPATIEQERLRALYVLPDANRSGLSSEEQGVALVDLVAALDVDGALWINDVIGSGARAEYAFKKLASGAIDLSSAEGTFDSRHRFTPSADVLLAVDRGYQIDVKLGPLVERLILKPLYEADRYAPYRAIGHSEAPAFEGPGGGQGSGGSRGSDGSNGSDGLSGGRGGDGAGGDEGGKGGPGGNAGPGVDGQAGEPGPVLEVRFRPIYSKFYPDEELLFMEVTATRQLPVEGQPSISRKNYIFHRGQKFVLSSIGGDGGAGGAGGFGGHGGEGGRGGDGGKGGRGGRGSDGGSGPGGDGGDGGEGGKGGHGGHGANGGSGGHGGLGGSGGDGGPIRARFESSSADLERAVRGAISFASVPGRGGAAGSGGAAGGAGDGGNGGDGGHGGDGGDGGSGTPRGKDGMSGKNGSAGAHGDRGKSAGRTGEPGTEGNAGRPGRAPW